MSEIKLKHCPICDGECTTHSKIVTEKGEMIRKFGVMCKNPYCLVLPAEYYTVKQAVEKWNIRKPMDMIVERLEALKNNVPNADFINGVVASLIEVTRENEE